MGKALELTQLPSLLAVNSTSVAVVSPLIANGTSGTSGQVLSSNGTTGSPYWVTFTGGATAEDDTSTNGTRYILFANQTSGSVNTAYVSSTKLTYNPSTGVLSSTVMTGSSDQRLKTNIETIQNPNYVLNNLRGVSFSRTDTGIKDYGVIAQEVESVLPDIIHQDQNGYKSVSYNSLIGFLIENAKQQQQKIDQLEESINKLLKLNNIQ